MRKLTRIALLVALGLAMAGGAQAALNLAWAPDANVKLNFSATLGSWGNEPIYNGAGTQLTGDDYLVQLVIDLNGDTVFADMISGTGDGFADMAIGSDSVAHGDMIASASDDIVGSWNTGVWKWANNAYYGYTAYTGHLVLPTSSETAGGSGIDETLYGNKSFYFRWFNTATETEASEVGIIHSAGFVTPATSIGTPTTVEFTYGQPGVAGSAHTGGPGGAGWQTVQTVPEPGTLALFGLGAVIVALRRRRS